MAVSERMRGLPLLQCSYFEQATSEQCPETGLARAGLCPEHLTYSMCGDAASCQKRAQVKGRCLEHAHEPQCQQYDCYRRPEPQSMLCREHATWPSQCMRPGCPNRTFHPDTCCAVHDSKPSGAPGPAPPALLGLRPLPSEELAGGFMGSGTEVSSRKGRMGGERRWHVGLTGLVLRCGCVSVRLG